MLSAICSRYACERLGGVMSNMCPLLFEIRLFHFRYSRGGDGVCEGVRGEDEREGESERTGEVRRGCGRVREVQAE